MKNDIQWWGYLHSNGTIQIKRWFGDHKDYTEDCWGNDFVKEVIAPFSSNSRKEAQIIIENELKRRGYSKKS